ncbi:MAG: alpha/beta hydrolase [bacterium]
MRIKYILLPVLILYFFYSCSTTNDDEQDQNIDIDDTEEIADDEEDNTPLIELEFTTPPIDLAGIEANYAADVPYDEFDLTTFDIFLPNSATPTGLVIFIHGGGFTGGDKDFLYGGSFPDQVITLLTQNIAVATINYRLLINGNTTGVLQSLNDSKRALQFMRYVHEELNIRKEDIALFGNSAGAGTSLWLGTRDDMADSTNEDPVLRESTRVKGVAIREVQASYDFEYRWVDDVFIDFNITWQDFINQLGTDQLFRFYGISSMDEYESEVIDNYRYDVDMLSHITSDDPEIWAQNIGQPNTAPETQGNMTHHAFHVREIKENADLQGVSITCRYGNPILFTDPNFEEFVDFLIRKIEE